MEKRLLIFALLFLAIFLPGYIQIKKLSTREKELQYQIKRLKENNAELLEETNRLKTDPFYIEKIAREKYGLAKQNEIAYRIEP